MRLSIKKKMLDEKNFSSIERCGRNDPTCVRSVVVMRIVRRGSHEDESRSVANQAL